MLDPLAWPLGGRGGRRADLPWGAMSGQVTRFLTEWRAGDPQAVERLVPLLYDELRALARRQLRRESSAHTLSATALVHEVYLRFLRQRQLAAVDRDGFLAIAGATMRRVLVDHARARLRRKRGGRKPESLDADAEPPLLLPLEVEEVLTIDTALGRLRQLDERSAQVVECRVFGGLTLEETARALDLSTRSVQRSWTTARAWLRKELGGRAAATP
jgi:RNA polymerase sigma factor (TIGR02999 family)